MESALNQEIQGTQIFRVRPETVRQIMRAFGRVTGRSIRSTPEAPPSSRRLRSVSMISGVTAVQRVIREQNYLVAEGTAADSPIEPAGVTAVRSALTTERWSNQQPTIMGA